MAEARKQILLVDDEVSVRNFYQLYLEHHGYAVTPAASIPEALHILTQNRFDLLIVDIFLGQDNGLDLVRGVLSANPEQPVVVISGAGYGEPAFEEALGTKAAGFYSKHLPLAQLLMEVRRILRENQPS